MVTDAFSDFVVGHGELWCARLFAATVAQRGVSCQFMDTREVLVVTSPDGKVVDVEYADSDAKLDAWAQKNGAPDVSRLTTAHLFLHPSLHRRKYDGQRRGAWGI